MAVQVPVGRWVGWAGFSGENRGGRQKHGASKVDEECQKWLPREPEWEARKIGGQHFPSREQRSADPCPSGIHPEVSQ